MPTVYQRLSSNAKYCDRLTPAQSVELGKLIADYYVHHKDQYPFPLRRKIQVEPSGTFTVLQYPKQFGDQMDLMIKEYCSKILPKKRKKIHSLKTRY